MSTSDFIFFFLFPVRLLSVRVCAFVHAFTTFKCVRHKYYRRNPQTENLMQKNCMKIGKQAT